MIPRLSTPGMTEACKPRASGDDPGVEEIEASTGE